MGKTWKTEFVQAEAVGMTICHSHCSFMTVCSLFQISTPLKPLIHENGLGSGTILLCKINYALLPKVSPILKQIEIYIFLN